MGIVVNRQKVCEGFDAYVRKYNFEDEKIRLKAEHTYRVSALCEKIAESLDMGQEDIDLAWLLGMLHDIGRFEQVKRYGTFMDAVSVNHAEFGAKLLFKEGLIHTFVEEGCVEDGKIAKLVYQAVFWHSAYRLPESLDSRTKLFCDILRDADKVDILRVNVEFSFEEIYNVPLKALRECSVSAEVMQAVRKEYAVLKDWRKTPIDYLVGHICLVYEMVSAEAVKVVAAQGYLKRLLDFQSENETTKEQFKEIQEKVYCYLERRIQCQIKGEYFKQFHEIV